MNPAVLITGATGFVGSRVAAHLVALGWRVHALVRSSSDVGKVGQRLAAVTIHRSDGSIESLRAVVRDSHPDVVMHLASHTMRDHSPGALPALLETNLVFATLLLEAMTLEGAVRLVNTGTFQQRFEGREGSPANLYAATKQAFEPLVDGYVELRGLLAITLRLPDVYGPDDPRDKLVPLLLRAAATGQPLAASRGDQYIDPVHVEDVARAYAQAAALLCDSAWTGHQRYAVTSGRPIKLTELVAEMEGALGGRVPVQWGSREAWPRTALCPWDMGPGLPGWKPQVALRQGLAGLR